MATGKDGAVGRQLRTLFNVGVIRELTDGQLLERFATGRGEGSELAFAALVERHGSMVLRVARGVLDDPNDAHDVFQATFLVLVAKARGLWVRDSLAPWLQQVAYRTASCSRTNAVRRRKLERRAALTEEAGRPEVVDDLARVLLEEIDRLPEHYRAPVVLCDLEGRTHEQAARALGWPVGTVKSRQARARQRLRDRLTRRGVAPGLAPLAGWPAFGGSIPASLVSETTVTAVRSVMSRAIAPGTAAVLAREVIRSMTIFRWGQAASVLLVAGAAASGAGLLAQDRGGKPGDGPKPESAAQAVPADNNPVVEIKPGKFNHTLFERGNLELSISRDLLCEVEGGTTIIMIKPEGTKVAKGDVVVELDSASLRDRLVNQKIIEQQAVASYKQAKLVREVAEYAVKEYTQGVYQADLTGLKGKVAVAQAAIEESQARQERTKRARQRLDEAIRRRVGPETPSDVMADLALADRLEVVELDMKKSKLDLEIAQTEQKVLQEYTLAKRTKQLQVDVERAVVDEQRRQASWNLELVKKVRLERQILSCTLHAPGAGLVVHANNPGPIGGQNRVSIQKGAMVRERQIILRIIDLADPMRVNAKVHESMVDRVKPGQAVRVKVDAAANEVLNGVVMSVAPMCDPTIAFNENTKVYTTFIRIEQDAGKLNLRPGMSAAVEILINERDGVLTVPIYSVVAFDEKEHVAVKAAEGRFEWREVTLGESNGEVVEVKDGLKPGDLVVLQPGAGMGLEMKRDMLYRAKPEKPPSRL